MTTTDTLDRWYSKNELRRLEGPPPDDPLLVELTHRGVAMLDFAEMFGSDALWQTARNEASRLREESAARPLPENDRKPFRRHLLEPRLEATNVFARIALDPALLTIVNSYLGMRSVLRSLVIWHTIPVGGPAVETQLWHRDHDDVMNVKLFVYLSDVTAEAGPFCFAPGTHPRGPLADVVPEHDESGRSTDIQMSAKVPESEWQICTGSPGTVVVADTCGYHKQMKPKAERLVMMAQYTSGTPFFPPDITLVERERVSWNSDQLAAVTPEWPG